MGGDDSAENLVELTIEEHAAAHQKLYEEYGRWQDYVAWQGLSKLDQNFDAARQAMIAGGRKGGSASKLTKQLPENREKARQITKARRAEQKYNAKTWNGKSYEVTLPNGELEYVEGLRQWCLDRDLNPNTVANACLRGSKTSGGYFVRRI